MNFVKTRIYKQNITEKGIEETEKDVRNKKEIENLERLKGLPEFRKDENFLSLSEQLQKNKNEKEEQTKNDNDNDYIDDILFNEESNLNENYLNDDYLHTGEAPIHKIEKKKEFEHVKKEYEEAINNVLKKNEKKQEKILLSKELANLKKVKKKLNKEKPQINKKLSIERIIQIQPNKKKFEDDNKPITQPIHLKKINEPYENKKSGLHSLLSGYSDESG